MNRRCCMVLAWLALFVACGRPDPGPGSAEWAGWRGPERDGSAPHAGLVAGSVPELSIAWNRKLGPAYSGVSVVEGKAVTMFSDGKTDHAVALNTEDGSEIWRYPIGATHRRQHPEADDGPLSMPAIHAGRVFIVGPRGKLAALELEDGRELWSLSMMESFGAVAPPYGFATSPAVAGETLIVQAGGGEGRAVLGLDPASGKPRWSHGDDTVAYQSPLLRTAAGPEQVVSVTDLRVIGLDPASGAELWSVAHVAPVRDGYAQVVFHGGDRMIGYYLTHVMGYRLIESGKGIRVEESWRSLDLKASLAVPVVHADRIYGFQAGRLTCLDARSGELIWRAERADGDVEERGILLLGELLIVVDAEGVLRVLDPATPRAAELARIETGLSGIYSAPTYAGGKIFLRNATHLAAVGIEAPNEDARH